MSISPSIGFPSVYQSNLIKACLCTNEQQLETLLKECVFPSDLRRADTATARLFPALFQNLRRLEVSAPDRAMLGGVYKSTWATNHTNIRAAIDLVCALGREGIPLMFLKGVPLLVDYYNDFGARPMFDLDLLVKASNLNSCISRMIQMGWKPACSKISIPSSMWANRYFRYQTFCSFRKPGYPKVNVHWRYLSDNFNTCFDEQLMTNSSILTMFNQTFQTLGPEDLLAHVVCHGSNPNSFASIRWVLDAATILKKKQAEFDWPYFLMRAKKLQISSQLYYGLSYLKATYDLDIPDNIVSDLCRNGCHGSAEKTNDVYTSTLGRGIISYISRYRVLKKTGGGEKFNPVGFFTFLYFLTNLSNPFEILRLIIRKIKKTSQKRLSETRSVA